MPAAGSRDLHPPSYTTPPPTNAYLRLEVERVHGSRKLPGYECELPRVPLRPLPLILLSPEVQRWGGLA
jgi:hypothetical protein